MRAELEPLGRSYDVVVANPPYMGSSSLGRWMSAWVKKRYPEAYRDLCTSFIDRGFFLSKTNGYSAMVTMQSWMFLGSFERLRDKILRGHSISSMAHLGTRAFGQIAGEVVSTTATVFANAKSEVRGAYFRLVDMGSEAEKREGLLEALADPDCGWFYRAAADAFGAIPGSPIAYWASDAMLHTFASEVVLRDVTRPRSGFSTGDNERFIHSWWEVNLVRLGLSCSSLAEANSSAFTWFPLNKGGNYRRWFGNNTLVVMWRNNASEMKKCSGYRSGCESHYFHEGITWGSISSSTISVRYSPIGYMPNRKGAMAYSNRRKDILFSLALLNSSVASSLLSFLAPTLDFSEGPVGSLPIVPGDCSEIMPLVESCIAESKADYDSFETSWDFKRNPLLYVPDELSLLSWRSKQDGVG